MRIERLGPGDDARVLAAGDLFDDPALTELARDRGCYGMWVTAESSNAAAVATYESAGAERHDDVVAFSWTFDA